MEERIIDLEKKMERMDRMEQRMDGIERRMDGIERRMDGIEQRMDRIEQRMDRMEQRMDRMESLLLANIEETKTLREVLSTALVKINDNFKNMNDRLDRLDKKVDALSGDTNIGFESVGKKIENLTGEISKIGTVTNYNEYYQNLKSLN